MPLCIPAPMVKRLKKAALEGKINMKELYNMGDSARHAFFEKHVDSELATFLNVEFERAMSDRDPATALKNWIEATFDPKAKTKPVYKTMLDKINKASKDGLLTPATEEAFLSDLVADELGFTATAEEVGKIKEQAEKIQVAQEALGDNLGDPAYAKQALDFMVEKAKMDRYLMSLVPGSKAKILIGTIGRGNMLFSLKSPFLNIGSNIEIGLAEAATRRAVVKSFDRAGGKALGAYEKMVMDIYQKTGYDISRMKNLSDTGASGARMLGDIVHAEGPGNLRKVGRFYENFVFKQLMGAPDVWFSSRHFTDSVGLNAMRFVKDAKKLVAKKSGTKVEKWSKADQVEADALVKDSMRVAPLTPDGAILRNQGILDAEVATWTDDTWASRLALGFRKLFNDMSGDARAGDYLFPFVKTPANVVATSIDYAGGGFIKAAYEAVNFRLSNTDIMTDTEKQVAIRKMVRGLVRGGIGQLGAWLITRRLKDEDFMGAYDPRRKQIAELRNSVFNAIRIDGVWYNMDWFGPISIPMMGQMYARQISSSTPDQLLAYALGVKDQVFRIPGVEGVEEMAVSNSYGFPSEAMEVARDLGDYVVREATARMTPSIMSDIAKVLDPVERNTKRDPIMALQKRIPLLRNLLPEKKNILGETVQGQNEVFELLFGSRVKKDRASELTDEMVRVTLETGGVISFTDWDRTSSKKILQLKAKYIEKYGEKLGLSKFEKASQAYKEQLHENLVDNVLNHKKYDEATDERKLDVFNEQDTKAMEETFKEFKYVYDKDWMPKDAPALISFFKKNNFKYDKDWEPKK